MKARNALLFEKSSYDNSREHLMEEIYWLNRKLAAYVIKMRADSDCEDTRDLKSFFISDSEIDNFLGTASDESLQAGRKTKDQNHITELNKLNEEAKNFRTWIDGRIEKSLEQKRELPLVSLAKRFNLTPLEVQSLVICVAPIVDSRYGKVYAYLHNDLSKKYPTKDLILNLLCDDNNQDYGFLTTLHHSSALIRYGFLEIDSDDPHSINQFSPVTIDSRIAQYILDHVAVDEKLSSIVRCFSSISWSQVIIPIALRQSLNNLMNYELSHNGRIWSYCQIWCMKNQAASCC
jgi:hypothetical protein